MIFLVVALKKEATPLISFFNLKKDLSFHKYEVFSNDKYTLVITKVGVLNSIYCLTDLFSKVKIKESDLLINIGIIGSSKYEIGEKILINQIKSDYYNNIFYPDILFNHNYITDEIITVNKESNNKKGNYDMESYGIFFVGKKYFNCDKMIFLKIVFDNLDKIYDISKIEEFINKLIYDIVYLVDTNIDFYINNDYTYFDNLCDKLNFTVSMKNIIYKKIKYLFLKGIDVNNILRKYINVDTRNKEERKFYYEKLKNDLQKYIY